jgi:hypothetical protein
MPSGFPPPQPERPPVRPSLRLAVAGVAIASIGAAMALVGVASFAAGTVFGMHDATTKMHLSPPSSESPAGWAPGAPTVSEQPIVIGAIRVTNIDPDAKQTFHQQLAEEVTRAASAHQTVVVVTCARWDTVSKEIQRSLADPRMQAALANVDLVRVDVDDFGDDLKSAGMLENTLPWFYKVDGALRPIDAISAGEWDDNVPENMAPVLRSFLAGTLRVRRDPTGMGGGTLL